MLKHLRTKNSYFITLPLKSDKKRGDLCFGEARRHIPFVIKRIYWIFNVSSKKQRGGHAHKKTEQVLFCLKGSVRIKLDDGVNKDAIILSKPNIGIFLGKMLWHSMMDFKNNSVLLVVASEFFKEADYIRDYNTFKSATQKQ
jgi:dTDP-4-dehydrorhamnose 3,5-epimerase-like enzyme